MRHLTPARASFAAVLLAVLGSMLAPSPMIAFYLTAVAAAGLIAAAFAAYLSGAEALDATSGTVVGLTSLAAALVMIDAAVAFPGALAADGDSGPSRLALIATAASALAVTAEAMPRLLRPLERVDRASVRHLLSR